MTCFEEIKKNFGFGCMRLPMVDGEVDKEEMCRMVDAFLERGFNYFDTAHGYLGGKSELALRDCLTSRYPRDKYILTNKLSGNYFKTTEDIRPLFQSQLEACGVEYFDFYLMHAQDAKGFARYKSLKAYETALELKAEGKIKHFGISFHDTAEVLDQILTEYPQIEIVQIQFNYVDYEDDSVQSKKCYEVCVKHGKPVIVMEPVKGGNLVGLPAEAAKVLDDLGGGSHASYAIRFAAGFENIRMVLSGMGSMAMMTDNLSYMENFQPLNETEKAAVAKVVEIIRAIDLIPCTGCRYCMEKCPKGIPIPNIFSCVNSARQYEGAGAFFYGIHTQGGKKASDCAACGKCETICPQHLPIRELLKEAVKTFEK